MSRDVSRAVSVDVSCRMACDVCTAYIILVGWRGYKW